MFEITQIGAETWWARKKTKRGALTEFDGNAFQGPNAEQQARDWAAKQEQT
jgi:hypothetical protein